MVKFLILVLVFLSGILFLFLLPKSENGQIIEKRDFEIKNEFDPRTVDLEEIFTSNHSFIATLSAQKVRTLIATGDVIPARSVNFKTVSFNDFTWPFEKTADVIKDSDLTFVDFESPLVKNCPITQEGMIFCGDPKNVEGLKFAGVDVANLANNHIENYGQKGVEETTNLLNGSSILATGISGPAFAYVRGLKFAFLGYNDISCQSQNISCSNDEKIAKEVVEAKTNSDIVIVAFHWGTEYTSQPTERQQKLAHLAIDSGADLIIGNHPHWIQPVENYGGKIITYAHGNFVFDQMWSQKTREGVVGKYTFYDKNLVDVEFLPVQIDDSGQPYFLEGKDKQRILDEMKQESIKLASNL